MTSITRHYGVRWQEFNAKDEVVTKERSFKTEAERDRFIEMVSYKDNFYRITAIEN